MPIREPTRGIDVRFLSAAVAVISGLAAPACGGSDAATPKKAPGSVLADGSASDDASPTDEAGSCGALGEACCAGAACDVTLACVRGACVSTTVETTPDRSVTKLAEGGCPQGIAVNATTVFWSDSTGSVNARPVAGGMPVVLASLGHPGPLALDATSVYWLDGDAGVVAKVPLAGGATTTLASGQNGPRALAVDGTSVYWTNISDGTIEKVPVNGGATTTVASAQEPYGIAVDSAFVYWTSAPMPHALMELALDGGTPTPLVTTVSSLSFSLAIDAQFAYWANSPDLVKAPLVGGNLGDVTVLATSHGNASAVAVDATSLYWIDSAANVTAGADVAQGDVMKVALGDGTLTTLASGAIFPTGIAVDGTNVYVTSCDPLGGQGAVFQVGPK